MLPSLHTGTPKLNNENEHSLFTGRYMYLSEISSFAEIVMFCTIILILMSFELTKLITKIECLICHISVIIEILFYIVIIEKWHLDIIDKPSFDDSRLSQEGIRLKLPGLLTLQLLGSFHIHRNLR